MPLSAELENIIQRAQGGDQDAIATLYETYAQPIYRYIVYRIPTQADAEDLTTEVFIKMVEGLPTYQITGAPFEAWLYSIARTRVAEWYRSARRHEQVELPETLYTDDPLPEEFLLQDQELATLREALQELNEEQQQVLVLRFVERKSHEEVAAIVGKSITAVKSIQHRALTRLSTLLGNDGKSRHYLRGRND